MGILFDYFAAASDEEAASAIDRVGGPSSDRVMPSATSVTPTSRPAAPRRWGLHRRTRATEPTPPPVAPEPAVPDELVAPFDTVSGFVDPVVQMGTLEELLTDRSFDEILEDPRCGLAVAERDGGETQVVTLSDSLMAALADASDERLAEVAAPWVATEEFWGEGDPVLAAEFLRDVAGLSRRAREDGRRLYCWICA